MMKKLLPTIAAVALIALAGCSSIDSEISALRAEEEDLIRHIEAVKEVRKKSVQLQTALEQMKQDDSSANERAVEEARQDLEDAKTAASQYI